MQHSSGTGYGENIYGSMGQAVNGAMPVQSWYSEIKDYRFGSGGFSMSTGHFTQVVWKGSTKLGVGRATGPSGWTYVVANYSPPGNYAGQFGSNVLPLGNYFTEEEPKPAPAKKESPPTKAMENLKVSDSSAPSTKTCTFISGKGEVTEQLWYHCKTCDADDDNICKICIKSCHKGHDIGLTGTSKSFCDCGSNDEGNCKVNQ